MPRPAPVMVSRVCACGVEFAVSESRLRQGRGSYCSKPCFYAHRVRPSGLKYNVKVVNRGWVKPGQVISSTGAAHHSWRGNSVGYRELHRWVARHRGRPTVCEQCGVSGRPIEWANKSHEYRRDLDDWLALCKPCHGRYDAGDNRGSAVRKYGSAGLR